MDNDYSKTPLLNKLGIKEKFRCCILHAPTEFFDLLGPLPEDLVHLKKGKDLDYIHLFVNSDKMLDQHFPKLKKRMKPTGMFWISYYKKSSKKATDVNANIIRGTARNAGMIDVKVCSINEDWSAIKFMLRKELRG